MTVDHRLIHQQLSIERTSAGLSFSHREHLIEKTWKHRIDAPALYCIDLEGNLLPGSCEWWLNNKRMKFKKFKELCEIVHLTNYPFDANQVSAEDLANARKILKERIARGEKWNGTF